jgi:hypothetical protein
MSDSPFKDEFSLPLRGNKRETYAEGIVLIENYFKLASTHCKKEPNFPDVEGATLKSPNLMQVIGANFVLVLPQDPRLLWRPIYS